MGLGFLMGLLVVIFELVDRVHKYWLLDRLMMFDHQKALSSNGC